MLPAAGAGRGLLPLVRKEAATELLVAAAAPAAAIQLPLESGGPLTATQKLLETTVGGSATIDGGRAGHVRGARVRILLRNTEGTQLWLCRTGREQLARVHKSPINGEAPAWHDGACCIAVLSF